MEDATASQSQSLSAAGGRKLFPASLMRPSLAAVNKTLGLVTAVAAAYFLFTIAVGTVKLMGVGHHIHQLELKGAEAAAKASPAKDFVKPAPVDPALDNRNIFQPAGMATSSSADAAAGVSGAATYRLVGISMSKNPADTYVMIENSQTKLTYFLQYGQPVEGLELDKILEDKVIVKIGGKAVEFE